VFRRLRHEDLKFEVSLGYIVKPCLKNQQTKKMKRRRKGSRRGGSRRGRERGHEEDEGEQKEEGFLYPGQNTLRLFGVSGFFVCFVLFFNQR
jgi:hypothetical protein